MGTRAKGRKPKGAGPCRLEASSNALLAEPPTGKTLLPRRTSVYPRSFPGPISSLCRWLRGGKKFFMELARLAPEIEPSLQRVIEEWCRLGPSRRIRMSIDEICKRKGVDPAHFIEVVAEVGLRFRDNASVFIVATRMPEIAERVAETIRTRQEQTREKPDRPAHSERPRPISRACQWLCQSSLVGGKKTFMELARLAPEIEPNLRRVIEEWDRLVPSYRNRMSIDEICCIKGIDSAHFIAVVGEAALRFRDNAQILIAALSAPSVVDRLVREAVKPDRVEYTRMFLQHTGFLPTPGGMEIRMNQFAAQQVNTEVDGNFPRVEDVIFEMDEIARPKSEPNEPRGAAHPPPF